MGAEAGAQSARARALAVLRVRSRALAVALLPPGAAVILFAGGSTGHLVGPGWDTARWVVGVVALVVLLAAGVVGLVVARARPAVSPTVAVAEEAAPDLYRLVRDLADRLDVPAPSAIALTPDCDSWLEDRTHPSHGPPAPRRGDEIAGAGPSRHHLPRRTATAPVLVIGSPFLWWMRVGELRAVLAPVVAGTGPSAHPDIAAARRFVRGLDAAVAVSADRGRCPAARPVCAGIGWVSRLMLRSCQVHAAEMERGVAAAAAERAQAVDYGLRIVAQEQVGLAYAGWDRLLTRVALPAWRMGRWPSRLDAGVVAALTELSRRDRLAEGFASRLGERPACDLLEEPGAVDEAASLLAARLFHGGPAECGPDWSPVDWQEYPEEVVDRKWRTDAARLHRVLDALGVRPTPDHASHHPSGPTLARVLDHLTSAGGVPPGTATPSPGPAFSTPGAASPTPPDDATDLGHDGTEFGPAQDGDYGVARDGAEHGPAQEGDHGGDEDGDHGGGRDGADLGPAQEGDHGGDEDGDHGGGRDGADLGPAQDGGRGGAQAGDHGGTRISDHGGARIGDHDGGQDGDKADGEDGDEAGSGAGAQADGAEAGGWAGAEADGGDELPAPNPRSSALAARLGSEVAREEATATAAKPPVPGGSQGGPDGPLWEDGALPLFPLQPPRTDRELLADHVTAMVCCAAMDTVGATPGLDWLDGPTLLVDGERVADLAPRVLSLVEDGDATPLRAWLVELGIRPEKPVRLG
ncbi:hypothetical protein [Streptomyces sp. DSM 15324]|uniref:hypothetical protein n=1 Tax=Streptomyces sp. DSM 15324 TaxID=1739111 RepID=UPI00074ABB37|nr:hypothetical protein [Streptomyces sp. DSM 15324]KUO08791.1 hypothetical protein AQJ58_29535 [Streptomyces sp. DSM 15324]